MVRNGFQTGHVVFEPMDVSLLGGESQMLATEDLLEFEDSELGIHGELRRKSSGKGSRINDWQSYIRSEFDW